MRKPVNSIKSDHCNPQGKRSRVEAGLENTLERELMKEMSDIGRPWRDLETEMGNVERTWRELETKVCDIGRT